MRIPFLKKERVDLSEPKNNLKEGKTEEPVYSKTIAGFRVWRIDEENLVLTSVTNNNPWHSGLNFANGCRKHAAPGSKCHCGFNAFYDLDTLDESAYKSLGIVGAFAGAGTVYIHKDGFRSSEAQLTALFYDEENLVESKETVEKIAYRYRVPLFDSRDEFLKYVSSVLPDLDRSELNLPEEKLDQFKNPRKKRQVRTGTKHRPESIKKMKEAQKGENNGFYGKNHSEESNQINREKHIGELNVRYGKKHTPETIKKMKKQTGKNHSQWGRRGKDCHNFGRKHSQETKDKISKQWLGKPSLGMHKRWHINRDKPNKDCVLCREEGLV